jgi:hypothetical protein
VLRGATTQAPRGAVAYGVPGAQAAAYGGAAGFGGAAGYGAGDHGGAGTLNAAGAGRGGALARAPIRPAEYADLLPPVQYQPAGGAQARPPAAAPYGAVQGTGPAPSRGAQTPVARPAPPTPQAGSAERARPPGLLGAAVMVIAIAVSVMLPVAGTIGALAVITLLRAGDRAQSALTARRSVRGPSAADFLVGVVTAPWAIARSLLTLVLLAPVAALFAAAVFVGTIVLTSTNSVAMAGGYAAGAAVACYGLGPGSAAPRRQLSRIFGAVARTRGPVAVLTLVMTCLAIAAVATAASQPALYWPSLSGVLPHLPSVTTLLHLPHVTLPHVTLPHFGVGRSRLGGVP